MEYNTEKYGNVDVDWMITLMAAHYGRAGWLLKGMDPKTIYRIGKPYWIIKDGLTDPDVDIDFSRYGQENEWNAVKAARDLIRGETSLPEMFGVETTCKGSDSDSGTQSGDCDYRRGRGR